MRIVFVSEHPNQVSAFSGIPYFMSRAVRNAAETFEYIQVPSYDFEKVRTGKEAGRTELIKIGNFLSNRLKESPCNLVVCQGSSMVPYLETDTRVVLWHDSLWLSLLQMNFDQFKQQYPLLYEWDQLTLEKCDLVVFAADWVRDQALTHYGVDAKKVHVIPFGANLDPVSKKTVKTYIDQRDFTRCHLTFLGIDWFRKGLPLAHQVVTKLNKRGLISQLTVIGCEVPRVSMRRKIKHYIKYQPLEEQEYFQLQFHRDPTIRKLGFLSKSDTAHYKLLQDTLQNTHFLLHPANFECFGIALAEANAFGIPVFATNNHGPKTIIRNGFNGYVFDQNEYIEATVEYIQNLMKNVDDYKSLALNAFLEYQNRFNWPSNFKTLTDLPFV